MPQKVLFISKPIAPPFRDGTKCLVRDIARNLHQVLPIVMSTESAPPLESAPLARAVQSIPVYGNSGAYTPQVLENLRAAAFVLGASRADIWHFVFAPNPRTSAVGRALRAVRGVPTVQTIASPPHTFDGIGRLLFGDIVVAQSQFTLERVREAFEAQGRGPALPRLERIPPPVPSIEPRSAEAVQELRQRLGIDPAAKVLVYPGDLETSRGAETTADLVVPLAQRFPDAVVVFAYRKKTDRAPEIASRLSGRVPARHARFAGDLEDVLALVAGASAVLFPVDDLRGKVDLPIVLLEAMDLGIPVLALDEGPLAELEGAVRIQGHGAGPWLDAVARVETDAEYRAALIHDQRRAVASHYRDRVVAARYERLYLEASGARRGRLRRWREQLVRRLQKGRT